MFRLPGCVCWAVLAQSAPKQTSACFTSELGCLEVVSRWLVLGKIQNKSLRQDGEMVCYPVLMHLARGISQPMFEVVNFEHLTPIVCEQTSALLICRFLQRLPFPNFFFSVCYGSLQERELLRLRRVGKVGKSHTHVLHLKIGSLLT